MTEDARRLDRSVSIDVRGVAVLTLLFDESMDSSPDAENRLVESDLVSGGKRDVVVGAPGALLSNMASLSDTEPACFFRTAKSRFTLPDFFSSSSLIQARRSLVTPRVDAVRGKAGFCDEAAEVTGRGPEEAADFGTEATCFCQACIRSVGVADTLRCTGIGFALTAAELSGVVTFSYME